MTKNRLKFLCSLSVGIGMLYLTLKYFDLPGTLAAIHGASVEKLLAAGALLIFAYLLRGQRWTIWEPGLKFGDSCKLILVGFMGNNILPARLGEILRAHCAAAYLRNNFGRTATLASIAIERTLDGFMVALIGILGLLLVPLGAKFTLALALVSLLFFLLTAALILGNYSHLKIRALFRWE